MVTFNEFIARRSIFHFIVLMAFALAAAIFLINKGLETVSDIETIENTPVLTLRKQFLEEGKSVESDIKKWRLYRNEDYGFEVKFPADYRFSAKSIELASASTEEDALVIVDAGKRLRDDNGKSIAELGCLLQLMVGDNPDRLTLTEWVRRTDGRVADSEEFFWVDGEYALRRAGGDRADNYYTMVYVSYKSRIFILALTTKGSGENYGSCREEFDLILSTVKFIR